MKWFTPAQSNPQFQAPGDPTFQFRDVGNTIDSIYNAYLQQKQLERQGVQDARAGELHNLQVQSAQGALANQKRAAGLADLQERFALGGKTIAETDPTVLSLATSPNPPVGPYSPQTLSAADQFKQSLVKMFGKQDLSQELTRAQIDKTKAEADKARGAGGLELTERARIESQLYDDYRNAQPVKNFTQIRDAYRNIAALAKNPSGISDIATVYALVKILDPNSVVREGEIALSNQATPLAQRLATAWNNAKQGRVSANEKNKVILDTAKAIYDEQKKGVESERSALSRRAAQYPGINPDVVFPDLGIPDAELASLGGGGVEEVPLVDGSGRTRVALYNGPKFVGWKQ